jgi:hypothetical protein
VRSDSRRLATIVRAMPNSSRDAELATLIRELDDDWTVVADEAQYALIDRFGHDALEPLLAAAPSFGDFGRLCAIEVFSAIGDRRAASVLIPWLRSDDEVVRGWSAGALGRLGATEAVEPLREAWEASKFSIPPDYPEAASLREALRALGARSIVLPPKVAALTIKGGEIWPGSPVWPSEVLPDVLAGLAGSEQVVLYFQYWRAKPPHHYRVPGGRSIDLDWTKPWKVLVADALGQGLAAAQSNRPAQTIASIEWIDRSDVRLSGEAPSV